MGGGDDGRAEPVERLEPGASQRWLPGQLGGSDRGTPGEPCGGRRDEVEDQGLAAPRPAHDDELRVRERDDGGEDSADGLAQGATRGRRPGVRAHHRGQEAVHVDGRRPRLSQVQLAEHLDERNRLAVRAGRDDMRELAG